MTITLSVPSNNETPELKPKITVIGVGGAGGNAVNNMIASQLEGVDFVVANTDAQALAQSKAERRVQMGATITGGLGAGSRPDIGRAAAEESIDDIVEQLGDSHMAFIAAGMGGGTGTGGAPVIARVARDNGILTVGVVTKPFQFEGAHRMHLAEEGIEELEQYVDTLIVIPNQNLFRVANEKTTFADAFQMADEVLYSGVRGVTDLMVMPGLINLDFADIRSVMGGMGKAMMGTGEGEGERRALDAAEAAIANPLLDDTSMKGAKGVLISITGGSDMTLFEVDEAANRIRAEVDAEARINFGSTFDDGLDGKIRVSVVATGMDSAAAVRPAPTMLPLEVAETKLPDPELVGQVSKELVDELDVDKKGAVIEIHPPIEVSQTAAPEPQAVSDLPPPPSGTPAAGAADAFIPPAPAEAPADGAPRAAEPFAAAAMANGGRESEPKAAKPPAKEKGPSLFEKVTGTGRAAKARQAAQEAKAEAEEAKPAPAAEAVPGAAPEAGAQNQLGGLDPEDRLSGAKLEDDLLDIPAFLRRQAN